MPTRPSYRPPPAIDPTPTVDSSGPSSALTSLASFDFFDFPDEAVTESEGGTDGLAAMEGGAEADVMAS